jgi:chromosome segregation ATPase
MSQQLASVRGRLEKLLHSLESGRRPERARLEETLTDGYACALKLDAECARLERSIGTLAAELDHASGEQQARELSRAARRLARAKRDLAALRGLLAALRSEAAEAKVA